MDYRVVKDRMRLTKHSALLNVTYVSAKDFRERKLARAERNM